jgi:hypothetical protein
VAGPAYRRRIALGTKIEEALAAAERVVVLWSKTSVKSAWVLDEAAAGRDSGRLIPVLIERVEPPLGFRQYQAIDLSGGRGAKAFAPLVAAVEGDGQHEIPPPRPVRGMPWKAVLIAAGLLLLAGAGWLWMSRAGHSDDSISVRVAAGNKDPRSADLARSIALDLSQYRAGPLGSLAILDPSDSSVADYAVDVTASGDPAALHADIAMHSNEAKGLLWSATIEGEGRKMVDIRQQAAANPVTCSIAWFRCAGPRASPAMRCSACSSPAAQQMSRASKQSASSARSPPKRLILARLGRTGVSREQQPRRPRSRR